mmetsp:Transcript_108171/g.304705  ORF Transcript_108171/g.304705 Transcript_108171/m.304705 type:complete len:204 (+) Transcript_108171:1440-2051(+)
MAELKVTASGCKLVEGDANKRCNAQAHRAPFAQTLIAAFRATTSCSTSCIVGPPKRPTHCAPDAPRTPTRTEPPPGRAMDPKTASAISHADLRPNAASTDVYSRGSVKSFRSNNVFATFSASSFAGAASPRSLASKTAFFPRVHSACDETFASPRWAEAWTAMARPLRRRHACIALEPGRRRTRHRSRSGRPLVQNSTATVTA